MTRQEYNEIGEKLPYAPEGRAYHFCAGEDGALYFTEFWESEEHLTAHLERVGALFHEITGPPKNEEGDLVVRPVLSVLLPGDEFQKI
jgi:hypothetical protein